MDPALQKSRLAYLFQGTITVIFGVMALAWPAITVSTLIVIFGVFALVVGLSRLATYFTNRRESGQRLILLAGLASTAAGLIALVWPGLTALALLFIIGALALMAGILENCTRKMAHIIWQYRGHHLWHSGLRMAGCNRFDDCLAHRGVRGDAWRVGDSSIFRCQRGRVTELVPLGP